jgi:hypothetical protein
VRAVVTDPAVAADFLASLANTCARDSPNAVVGMKRDARGSACTGRRWWGLSLRRAARPNACAEALRSGMGGV